MQALSDEQQLERLERKVDDGFAEMRAEFRSIRSDMATQTHAIWGLFVTMIFGFAGITLTMLVHL
jgi:hypothetical protein